MTRAWTQIRHPAPQVPRRTTADEEYQRFWGPLQATPTTSSPSSRQTVPMISMSHPSQENHVFHDELLEFWHGHVSVKHGLFSGSYQDFHAAISQPTQREPVPVPSPATLHSNFSTSTASVMQCRGEGWWESRPTWSPSNAANSANMRAKQVDIRRCCPKAVKRAYRRACRRAREAPERHTWYRGQWLSDADLRRQYVTDLEYQAETPQHTGGQAQRHGKQSKLFSWNAGGLASNTWDALQTWLAGHSVDFCCIQETHWPMVQEWCSGQYHVYHHGQGRSGGLMTLVRTKIAGSGAIRSGVLADGRIQHTRIYNHQAGVDIVNVYQKVWAHGSVDNIKSQRKTVWNALAKCLDSIPARNQVLVCGGMNTQLPSLCDSSRPPGSIAACLEEHSLSAYLTTSSARLHNAM